MRARTLKPRQLDVEAFAEQAGELGGASALVEFTRLVDLLHPGSTADASRQVDWQARGERRQRRGAGAESWLHLTADTRLALTCQRCLQAVDVDLALDRHFRFVADEAKAAEADIDADEDLLATSRSFDLLALVEDELLLALPIVPRHGSSCPEPLPVLRDSLEPQVAVEPERRPFEALAVLKRAKPSS